MNKKKRVEKNVGLLFLEQYIDAFFEIFNFNGKGSVVNIAPIFNVAKVTLAIHDKNIFNLVYITLSNNK